MLDFSHLPRWLQLLLTEKFYDACLIHEDEKKNMYCLDCCNSICSQCLPNHPSDHRLLKIRRYLLEDVIKLDDAKKLINCDSVQSYITNGADVVFLNQRAKRRQVIRSANNCTTCNRKLKVPFLHCSLSCKIHHLLKTEDFRVSEHIYECESLTRPEPGLDDGQMTPNSILEPGGSSVTTSSWSSGGGGMDCPTPVSDSPAAKKSRRKGTPHRSPLF